jgi:hypothetical protein
MFACFANGANTDKLTMDSMNSVHVEIDAFSASPFASENAGVLQVVAHGPTASFTPLNGTSFRLGDNIFLNGTYSTPGYDTLGAVEICPIINYAWVVKYPNGTVFGSYSGAVVSFIGVESTPLEISLLVTAPDPHSPAAPEFTVISTHVAWINVGLERFAAVDVFTDSGGIGFGVSGAACGSQELINMHASVTYREVPVVNRDVVFSVVNPVGSIVAVRVVRTNEAGLASAEFRLPTADPHSSGLNLGTWSILASVDVSQVICQDRMNFTFNFLSKIQDIQLPVVIGKTQSLPINFAINGPLAWSELDITLFDNMNVPIGSVTLRNTQPNLNYTSINTLIPIPSWASSGSATAYICLFSSTDASAVPLAPESIARFYIQ